MMAIEDSFDIPSLDDGPFGNREEFAEFLDDSYMQIWDYYEMLMKKYESLDESLGDSAPGPVEYFQMAGLEKRMDYARERLEDFASAMCMMTSIEEVSCPEHPCFDAVVFYEGNDGNLYETRLDLLNGFAFPSDECEDWKVDDFKNHSGRKMVAEENSDKFVYFAENPCKALHTESREDYILSKIVDECHKSTGINTEDDFSPEHGYIVLSLAIISNPKDIHFLNMAQNYRWN